MKLQEALEQFKAEQMEQRQSERKQSEKNEQHIIQELAGLGVLAVDGWDVRSNFPVHESVMVAHPELPHKVLVTLDYDLYPVPLRGHIEGEHPELADHIAGITTLVEMMGKAELRLKSEEKPATRRCPVVSADGNGWCDCIGERCAWWDAGITNGGGCRAWRDSYR